MNDNQIKENLINKTINLLDQVKTLNEKDSKNILTVCKSLAQLNLSLLNNLEAKDKFINHLLDVIKKNDVKLENKDKLPEKWNNEGF